MYWCYDVGMHNQKTDPISQRYAKNFPTFAQKIRAIKNKDVPLLEICTFGKKMSELNPCMLKVIFDA